MLHCYIATLLQCNMATLLHCYIATLLHCYIATFIHRYIAKLLHFYIATLLNLCNCKRKTVSAEYFDKLTMNTQCYIATLLHCYIYTSLHCYIATLLHCYIATLLHCYIYATAYVKLLVQSALTSWPRTHEQPNTRRDRWTSWAAVAAKNKETDERTHKVTSSLLELLVAAKKHENLGQMSQFKRAFRHRPK